MLDETGGSPTSRAWADAVRQQARVISALIRREMLAHFGEMRLGYLWALIEPLLHLVVLMMLFTFIMRRHSELGGSLLLFMVTGLIPYFLFYKLSTYLSGAIDDNRALLNLPPVKPFDVIISRAILETTTYLLVAFILLTGIGVGGGESAVPYHPMRLAGAVASTVGFGFGIGIINLVIRVFLRNWTTIFALLVSPIFLLSGIWFLPAAVPPPFRDYLLYNPLMHYIMWVRSGFYRNYDPVELDRSYAIGWSILTVVVGLVLLRVARRKLLEPT